MIALFKEAQPTREEFPNPDGSVIVQVTQAKMFAPNANPVRVYLTKPEYRAYREWLDKQSGTIQHLLPTLSASQREMLMTGIGDEEFEDIVKALDAEFIDPEEDADSSNLGSI